jgi:SH3-like domain-containing protein
MKSLYIGAVALMLFVAGFAQAQERGPVTNLPLPRFVSMKTNEGNIRRGPGMTHRIDWVFKHKNLPLEITAEYGHWRRVRDRDGVGGWIHYSLLSGARTAIIERDMLGLQTRPDTQSLVVARLELGVIARLEECNAEWCKLSAAGYRGWVPKSDLWGIREDEILH